MWSGTTLTNFSGSVIGAHQKIDRVARKFVSEITDDTNRFPAIRDILHFEGKNGPDGIKSKSPAKDEPWHFYDPFDVDDTQLIEIMEGHYNELVKQLKKGSPERAAFDAAWLAHTMVDGLTPAHHFPYEEKLIEIRGGDSLDTRDSIKSKVFMPGVTVSDKLKSNWAMYGVGGLLSMHGLFEIGAGFLLAPIKMKTAKPSDSDINTMIEIGYQEVFKRAAREIALLDMYDRFNDNGWSVKLSRDVRNHLGPIMAKTVCLVWYSAIRDAGILKGKR
ncbi:hypothetical protein KBB49_01510 [Candidatus Saccharibacteria bacterium]|nr:hypothetical protein [Candidatus Saccharibacteria bacterium]